MKKVTLTRAEAQILGYKAHTPEVVLSSEMITALEIATNKDLDRAKALPTGRARGLAVSVLERRLASYTYWRSLL